MTDLNLDTLLAGLEDTPELTKEASEAGATVADELQTTLTKQASEEDRMTITGEQIANSILANLEKVAENNVIAETASMEADDTAKVKETPRSGKTVTETAKALLATGGGVSEDGGVTAENEGNQPAAAPTVPSNLDKVASLCDLMDEGMDFEDAAALVKQASDELVDEAADLEKAAAVQHLMGEGINFDDAIALVKQASEAEFEVEYSDMEKAAATQQLMEEDGMSFDEAAELVKEAALGKLKAAAGKAANSKAGKAALATGGVGLMAGNISGTIGGAISSHQKSYRDGKAEGMKKKAGVARIGKGMSKSEKAKAFLKKNGPKAGVAAAAVGGGAAGLALSHKVNRAITHGMSTPFRSVAQKREENK